MQSETSKTKFLHKLKEFGYYNFFVSPDFIIAFSFLIFSIIDKYFNLGYS